MFQQPTFECKSGAEKTNEKKTADRKTQLIRITQKFVKISIGKYLW
jgi:hypothetical protein